jgi:AcrR family transcriptional regulator
VGYISHKGSEDLLEKSSVKRRYNASTRHAKAAQTKNRILSSAKTLFEAEGIERVTIEKIAQTAEISIPTIYALFQSKRGLLRAIIDDALPADQFETLVIEGKQKKTATERLAISAKMARQIYDAERAQMEDFWGTSILTPEFKELEKEREQRRYARQEDGIKKMMDENMLAKRLSVSKARDILWAFTGRDMYRLFVVEQKWTSDKYEKWLAEALIKMLTDGE